MPVLVNMDEKEIKSGLRTVLNLKRHSSQPTELHPHLAGQKRFFVIAPCESQKTADTYEYVSRIVSINRQKRFILSLGPRFENNAKDRSPNTNSVSIELCVGGEERIIIGLQKYSHGIENNCKARSTIPAVILRAGCKNNNILDGVRFTCTKINFPTDLHSLQRRPILKTRLYTMAAAAIPPGSRIFPARIRISSSRPREPGRLRRWICCHRRHKALQYSKMGVV